MARGISPRIGTLEGIRRNNGLDVDFKGKAVVLGARSIELG